MPQLNLSTDSHNGSARAQAFAATVQLQPEPTAVISYSSTGSVYILGRRGGVRTGETLLA